MKQWLKTSARGVGMGVADTIPGVSGGTIALLLGIYEQFVTATSEIGPALIRALFTRAFWRRFFAGLKDPGALADEGVDRHAKNVLFLGFLVLGIVTAVVIGARFIPDLLTRYPSQMKGFFFGLVLASCAIPYRLIKRHTITRFIAFFAFAAATFFFVALPIDQSQQAHGTVTVTFARPLEAPVTLTPWQEQTTFSTNRFAGAAPKREIRFLPTKSVDLTVGATSAVVPVRAMLAGTIGNVPAGEVTLATGLPEGATFAVSPLDGGSNPALWYIFLAGMLAISAMVLPGISGSFVLLMLGLYHYIFYNLRLLLYERDTAALPVILVFIAALIVGIATFSRFLKWLFSRYHDLTLAALIGIMAGSLRELWPFKAIDGEGVAVNTLPAALDGAFAVTIACVAVGLAIVLGLERLSRKPAPASQT
jgi:putative membrane protein